MMHPFGIEDLLDLENRLHLITVQLRKNLEKTLGLYRPRNFPREGWPVFFTLLQGHEKTIAEISDQIRKPAASVAKIVEEMTEEGWLKLCDKGRVQLTEKSIGFREEIIKTAEGDLNSALRDIPAEEGHHSLQVALSEWALLWEDLSIFERVKEQKKLRESKDIRIVDYEPRYQPAFKSLNEEWISAYFELEDADREVLNHPEKFILSKGGKIFVALYKNEPLGVCALIKSDDSEYDFEMGKMAVSPEAQGKNMGWLLGKSVIQAAREMGASKIYLESNTLLKPAINLYYKLGFVKISRERSARYNRVDIHMELDLENRPEENIRTERS